MARDSWKNSSFHRNEETRAFVEATLHFLQKTHPGQPIRKGKEEEEKRNIEAVLETSLHYLRQTSKRNQMARNNWKNSNIPRN